MKLIRISSDCYETKDRAIVEEICRRVYAEINNERVRSLEIERMRKIMVR